VLASYGDRTVMGDDLESTLAALFMGSKSWRACLSGDVAQTITLS
jgi:hypothetical protein